jgi:hypothetical protein
MAFLLNSCLFFFNYLFNKEICHDSTILNPDDFKDTVSPYTQNRTGKADFLLCMGTYSLLGPFQRKFCWALSQKP